MIRHPALYEYQGHGGLEERSTKVGTRNVAMLVACLPSPICKTGVLLYICRDNRLRFVQFVSGNSSFPDCLEGVICELMVFTERCDPGPCVSFCVCVLNTIPSILSF